MTLFFKYFFLALSFLVIYEKIKSTIYTLLKCIENVAHLYSLESLFKFLKWIISLWYAWLKYNKVKNRKCGKVIENILLFKCVVYTEVLIKP